MVKWKKNKKSNFLLILAVSMGLLLSLSCGMIIYANYSPSGLTKVNYLGLAQLSLIPDKVQCTHDYNLYDSTGVIMQSKTGNKYLILMSKFGDETCLYKLT